MIRVLQSTVLRGWISLVFLLAVTSAFGQANLRQFRAGEWLVSVRAGTPRAAVDALATATNSTIVRYYGVIDFEKTVETYYFRSTAQIDDAATLKTIDTLKNNAFVKDVIPNRIYRINQAPSTAIPNDPRWNLQWDMTQINMPQAWTLEKGQSNVVVVSIDTGVDLNHPDIDKSRILNPFNANTNSAGQQPVSPNLHGTLTSGFVIATTNNSVGQAGIAWNNIKLMPILAGFDDPTKGFTGADIITAIQYVAAQAKSLPNMKFVVNMSLGGGDATTVDTPDPATLPADELAILNAAKSGILFVLSAGNDGAGNNFATHPAHLAAINGNIICVAATGPAGTRAVYSQRRAYTTIAAPGGDSSQGAGLACLVPTFDTTYAILPDAQHVGAEGGTSSAAPHVSGVAALLLSIPGVNVSDIKPLIQATARRVPGATVPSADYGYGIIDAYAALLKVAISVTIVEPDGTGGKASGNTQIPEPIETLRPTIRIQVSQVIPANLKVTIDNGPAIAQLPTVGTPTPGVPYYTIENVTATTTDPNDSTIILPANYQIVIRNADLAPGQHRIDVSGTKPGAGGSADVTVTDTRNITVTPHVIPAGRSMVSFPYYEYINALGQVATDPHDPSALNQITPQTYFGTNFRLARWLPDQERYVFYTSFGQSDNSASFTPVDVITRQDGDPARLEYAKWPLGLGFFSDTESAKPILTKGQPVTDKAFIIPLKGNGTGDSRFVSWNMVGDPFPFDLPFNSLLVDTPTGRISLQDAADRGYILPNIYTYDGANGYTFRTLPDGALRAWNGHWIGVTSKVDLNLVLPPAKLTRAASAPTTSAGSTVWKVQLSAHVKNLNDTFNFIGVGTKAQDGYDRNDVAKPPMVGPYVSVGVSHSDWAEKSGLYAQDIRSGSGTKSWSISVDTDQPNSDVTINWNAGTLPRNVRLMLKDESNGATYDMRSRTALTFNSGSSSTSRKFTVVANQSVRSSLRIGNLNVRGGIGRASGSSIVGFTLTSDATYEVKVLNASGSSIGTVGSRAAAASGDVSLVWNGRDNGGKPVAAGTYLIQVRATSADGDSVKAIMPFTVVR